MSATPLNVILMNSMLLNKILLNKHINGRNKQVNIKNQFYCFYRNLIDLKDFDAEFLKIDKKLYKNIDIYYIGYSPFIKIGDYWSNFMVNPLYLDIAHASGYIESSSIEEKNGNKYLVLDDIDENKEVLKNMKKFGRVLKKKLKLLMVAKKLNMGKIFKKLNLILMMAYH